MRQAELAEVIVSPDDLLNHQAIYPFGGAVRRGNSGSPVLDNSGAVLGIVRAKIRHGRGVPRHGRRGGQYRLCRREFYNPCISAGPECDRCTRCRNAWSVIR